MAGQGNLVQTIIESCFVASYQPLLPHINLYKCSGSWLTRCHNCNGQGCGYNRGMGGKGSSRGQALALVPCSGDISCCNFATLGLSEFRPKMVEQMVMYHLHELS